MTNCSKRALRWLALAGFLFHCCDCGRLLTPGILRDKVDVHKGVAYFGYPHAAYNGTEVELRFQCLDDEDYEYEVQFALRSSPCDKEFFDVRRNETVGRLLKFYFEDSKHIPANYHYEKMVYYKSSKQTFKCTDDVVIFTEEGVKSQMRPVKVKPGGYEYDDVIYQNANEKADDAKTQTKEKVRVRGERSKRAVPGLNGNDTIDGGTKLSLTSWHPIITLPIDAIYFIVIKLETKSKNIVTNNDKPKKLMVEVQWRGPYGLLSAIDYPLLPFYGVMCAVYGVLAIVWFILCAKYWRDLLRIQFWIGAVIFLGMVEKAVFYAEYQTMNATGESVGGAIELAELVSCLKRTLSRMLIIIVSVGFGLVKPRLGSTLHQVVGVGFVYFMLCAIEGVMRVSKHQPEAAKQKQLALLPLVLLEVGIFWWIFTSLVTTMRSLRLRRNNVKLSLYRHFTNTLALAVLASVGFMFWSMYEHVFTDCLQDWKELWIDTGFWHLLFCTVVVVIMFLWRPSNNNQRYAFTPLLDNSEDENDDDEIFNSDAFVTDAMKLHQPSETKAENRKQRDPDQTLQDELKWVEENIPSSVADKLIADSDEDAEQTRFELSKMQ